jgi:DNA modification methylase
MLISAIKPYAKNSKKHTTEQIQRVADSIKRFGFIQPLVIDKNNEIVIGHCRYEAAKLLALKEVPVITVEKLTDQEVKALRIADNKLNESEWDMELALEDLKGLSPELFDLTGFNSDLLIEPDARDDVLPENPPPVAKLGDIWQLGSHKIMCGDSTLKENIDKLMDGKKADMVFTDPPYGMDLKVEQWNTPAKKGQWKSNKKNYTQVIGDTGEFSAKLINTIFENFNNVSEIFIWGADYFAECLPKRKNGSWVVWDKRSGGLENVKWTTSEFELCWSKIKHHRKIARIRWMGVNGMEKEDTNKRVHPTQKPVELIKWFFNYWGDENDIVADLFLGSGSTLIACEKTNRICFGMELDPRYVSVILQRWADYTGLDPVREDGKKWSELKATKL